MTKSSAEDIIAEVNYVSKLKKDGKTWQDIKRLFKNKFGKCLPRYIYDLIGDDRVVATRDKRVFELANLDKKADKIYSEFNSPLEAFKKYKSKIYYDLWIIGKTRKEGIEMFPRDRLPEKTQKHILSLLSIFKDLTATAIAMNVSEVLILNLLYDYLYLPEGYKLNIGEFCVYYEKTKNTRLVSDRFRLSEYFVKKLIKLLYGGVDNDQ